MKVGQFQNIGRLNSDAGESPKRKNITCTKFQIKNKSQDYWPVGTTKMNCLKIRAHQDPETQRRPYESGCLLLQSLFAAGIFSAIYINYL
jgi:hypothetical protein